MYLINYNLVDTWTNEVCTCEGDEPCCQRQPECEVGYSHEIVYNHDEESYQCTGCNKSCNMPSGMTLGDVCICNIK